MRSFSLGLMLLVSTSLFAEEVSLKEDWIVDSEGDEVLVLDNKVLIKLKSITDGARTSVYSGNANLEQAQLEILSAINKINTTATYEVQAGDTLRKIAVKLYNNENKWKEIYYLNKELLAVEKLSIGTKLKVRPADGNKK